MSDAANSNFILPPGTQIVTLVQITSSDGATLYPRGAVGVIVKSPADNSHSYRARLADGFEASLHRREIAVLRHFQRETITNAMAELDLYDFVIYRCVVGSRAYGLEEEGSDTDRRGIYLPPASLHWSLYGVPEQIENHEAQECYWELQKFLILALKANPNVLECLYTPIVETATPLAEELISMRSVFLSKLVYQTYNGYVMSQFKKLEQDISRGSIKWKHAMHLVRLLVSGVTVMKEGYVPVRVEAHRERLLAIRRGEVGWEEINEWRLRLHKEFDAALAQTKLPDRPDYHRANEFLLKARRQVVDYEP
ncbi:MAG: nucleotidyltransferase domain-containing protein [Acidobacteriota bacterium]